MAPEPAPGLMKVSLHNPIESKAKRKSSQSATNDPVGHESLRFEYERNNSTLDISFRRTVRVPDNDRSYDLPPDGGAFPLYSVNRHRRQLPADIVDKGGVFLPIYQREAMWIDFTCEDPFAVKLYVGGVNAISGEPRNEDLGTLFRRSSALSRGKCIQDYLVADQQYWIDGIAKRDGTVMQFVATPTGTGYSVEAQVTGLDSVCGVQLEIVPCRGRNISITIADPIADRTAGKGEDIIYKVFERSKIQKIINAYLASKRYRPILCRFLYEDNRVQPDSTFESMGIKDGEFIYCFSEQKGGGGRSSPTAEPEGKPEAVQEMAIAPGGLIEQTITKDEIPAEEWDTKNAIMTNISLINASSFKYITGFKTPRTPITATTYAKAELPFFKEYKEPSGIKGNFKGIRSVAELDRDKNHLCVEVHDAEKDLDFPTVDISKKRSSFVPVEKMERRAKRVRVSNDL